MFPNPNAEMSADMWSLPAYLLGGCSSYRNPTTSRTAASHLHWSVLLLAEMSDALLDLEHPVFEAMLLSLV